MRDPRFRQDVYHAHLAKRRRDAESEDVAEDALTTVANALRTAWNACLGGGGFSATGFVICFDEQIGKLGPEAGNLLIASRKVMDGPSNGDSSWQDRAAV